MRVGILSQWFDPEPGPASIPGALARGLTAAGHHVQVVTGYPNYPTGDLYPGYRMRAFEDSELEGYRVRRVALYPNHSSRLSGRLVNFASFAMSSTALGVRAFKNIDALWVYNSPATVAVPMWTSAALYKTPVVLHNMDMWPDTVMHTGFAPSRGASAVMAGLDSWVNRMYESAEIVAYISPSAGVELERRGVPPEKLKYAPVWIDEGVYRPFDGSLMRRQLGCSEDDVVVGYAGALGHAQGVTRLMRLIADEPPGSPLKCVIMGSGTEQEDVRTLARQFPDRLAYMGQVPHSEMTAYSAVPDISFVGLSRSQASLFTAPSKVQAIMACGKPILAAAAGDTAALVTEAGAGVVCEPESDVALLNALVTVRSLGRVGLAEMGAKSLAFGRLRFSEGAATSRIGELLEEAASGAFLCRET